MNVAEQVHILKQTGLVPIFDRLQGQFPENELNSPNKGRKVYDAVQKKIEKQLLTQ